MGSIYIHPTWAQLAKAVESVEAYVRQVLET